MTDLDIRFLPRETIDALKIKRVLGRDWFPPQPYGEDCWWFDTRDPQGLRIIVSPFGETDGSDWIHASISRLNGEIPTYDDLTLLHRAVFGDGYAYQCFVPASEHINITENVLHLWGRLDGMAVLPDFGRGRTI